MSGRSDVIGNVSNGFKGIYKLVKLWPRLRFLFLMFSILLNLASKHCLSGIFADKPVRCVQNTGTIMEVNLAPNKINFLPTAWLK